MLNLCFNYYDNDDFFSPTSCPFVKLNHRPQPSTLEFPSSRGLEDPLRFTASNFPVSSLLVSWRTIVGQSMKWKIDLLAGWMTAWMACNLIGLLLLLHHLSHSSCLLLPTAAAEASNNRCTPICHSAILHRLPAIFLFPCCIIIPASGWIDWVNPFSYQRRLGCNSISFYAYQQSILPGVPFLTTSYQVGQSSLLGFYSWTFKAY